MSSIFEHIVCSYLIICEKLLSEQDGVISAVRMIDVIFTRVQIDPPPKPPEDLPFVALALLFMSKVKAEALDGKEHAFLIRLIRPDGESTDIGPPTTFLIPNPKIQTHLTGINIGVPQIRVKTKQMGLHYFIAYIDDKEVARSPFILSEQLPEIPR